MNISFPQIRHDKPTKDKDGGIFVLSFAFGSILLSAIIIYFLPRIEFFFLLLIPIFISRFLIRKMLGDWPKKKDIIGEVEFGNDGIKCLVNETEKIILYNDIKYLKLNSNYIKGKQFGSVKDINHNGLQKISLATKDEEITIKFLIVTEKEWENLRLVLKTFYLSGIKVKEFLFKHEYKTILLNSDWSYEEIQHLKKELGVSDFYN